MGDADAVEVFPDYAKAHGLPGARPASQAAGTGIGGVTMEGVAVLRTIAFGGVAFASVPAAFPFRRETPPYPADAEAVVGMGVLSRFHLIVDLPHQRLYLSPNNDAGAPFKKNRLGLMLDEDGGALDVLFVAPGSPAAGAGLKTGDCITAIDGKPAKMWTRDLRTALAAGAAGTEVTLTLTSGETKTLTLADYF